MKKTKITSLAMILAILTTSMFFAGCTQQDEDVIKIGVTLALSGAYSFHGGDLLNSLTLAEEDINLNSEKFKIKLIVEDNKGDATEATQNVNKLLNIDDLDLIFSAFTHITQAVKTPVFNNEKILFYQSTFPDIAKESDLAFRDYYDIGDSGKLISEAVYLEGHKQVKLLYEQSEACELFINEFKNEIQNEDIDIIQSETFLSSENDFKTYLLKLNLNEEDGLVVCTWRHEHIFMKQLKELNLINIQTFHFIAPFFPSADTAELRELYLENKAISTWYGLPEYSHNEQQQQFIERYYERFGNNPRPDSIYAYDDLMFLINAANMCGGLKNNACIIEFLKENNYAGISGLIKFDSDGNSKRDILLIKLNENKDWVEYQ